MAGGGGGATCGGCCGRRRNSKYIIICNCWGLSGAAWGLLRLPEADLYLIPGFDTDLVFPPILPFFSPTVHD